MKEGPIKLLGLSGSLRKESASTALLKSLEKVVKDKAELSIFSLAEIPIAESSRHPMSRTESGRTDAYAMRFGRLAQGDTCSDGARRIIEEELNRCRASEVFCRCLTGFLGRGSCDFDRARALN
jgi:hypothetical protein